MDMYWILQILHNFVLISAISAWVICQLTKTIIDLFHNGFHISKMVSSGGMPSTHAATVTALSVSSAFYAGLDSPVFAVALILAVVVIYDSHGVRYETGLHAKALNKLRRRDLAEGKTPVSDEDYLERVGHTLPEIVVGIIVGAAVAIIICAIVFGLELRYR